MLSFCPLWSLLGAEAPDSHEEAAAPFGDVSWRQNQDCYPALQTPSFGGRPARAWKPSLPLPGRASQELEGSLSASALTGDVRSRDGHEPWDFTCWTCRGSWCPRGQVPESLLLEGRKAASLILSSLYLGIHRHNCSMYLNCHGRCDRQGVIDGCQGWEEAQLWLQAEFCSSQGT